jgi:cytochrome b561
MMDLKGMSELSSFALFTAPAMAQEMDDGQMMDDGMMGMMWLWWLIGIAVLVLLVAVIWRLFQSGSK